jgi:two-component system, NtrC family, nitrogen regulation response regulator NtrX
MNSNKKPLILIVDDEPKQRDILADILTHEGYSTLLAKNGEGALNQFETNPVDLVLLDYKMPGMDGVEVLKRMKNLNPLIPVLLLSAFADVPLAVKATQIGAVDVVEKVINTTDLLDRIKKQLVKGEKLQKIKRDVGELFEKYSMIGLTENMQVLYKQIDQVAPVNVRVLITGETGVGKELVANAIHRLSIRVDQPFIKVNCASIPTELIESELFGFRKYSFTDAKADRKGKFQLADKGTLFLDEIGDMSMMTQAKVLHAIESGEIQQIGSTSADSVDVRVIAATNKDLEHEVETGRFREDLFYRLNVVTIEVPALNKRIQDIPFLVEFFLNHFCEQHNKKRKLISNRAMECLIKQEWKGNVRELRNLMEKLVIFIKDEIIDLVHINDIFGRQRLSDKLELDLSLKEARDQFEKDYIETKLIANGWKIGETADQLGMERTNLYRKMKQLEIEQP